MYIEPSTHIRLLKDVPLDSTYTNTLYFKSATDQVEYFIGKTKYLLTAQTYQRETNGIARVGYAASDIYDCNYMMFKNPGYGSKWFYAFITEIEYVNNVVSRVHFEIDVMQTWYFNYHLKESFVEREHSKTDKIGENLIPEKLDTGEYVCDGITGTGYMNDYKIVVASSYDKDGNEVKASLCGGVMHGFAFNYFDRLGAFIDWYDGLTADAKSDGIHAVFMYPTAFCAPAAINIEEEGSEYPCKKYTVSIQKKYDSLGGYEPRNNKLFTHPYNFLYVTNLDGLYAEYPYEYFNWVSCDFTLAGDMCCNPTILLYPMHYKGTPLANIDEKLTLTGFPMCSWSTDAFKAWLAQNSGSLISSGVNTLVGTAASLFTNPISAGVNAISYITSTVGQFIDRARAPRQAHGLGGSSALVALKQKDFGFMHKHITSEYAKIIDEFFDMYGYATHRVKIPNISSRPCWNYVKTVGCNAFGSVPADDMAKIKSVYDNGITFWKTTAVIGCYDHEVNDNRVNREEE